MNDIAVKLKGLADDIANFHKTYEQAIDAAYQLGIEQTVTMMNKSAYKATCRKCGFEQTYLEEVPADLLCGECAR